MSALSEVFETLRAAVGRLPNAQVAEARTRIADDLVPKLDELSEGTANQDLINARTTLRSLIADVERVFSLLRTVQECTERWLYEFGAGPGPTPIDGAPAVASRPTISIPARVAHYRAQLDHPWPYGRPLKGWRLDPAGRELDVELSSGDELSPGQTDPAYAAAAEKARSLGLARRTGVPVIAEHIEIKEASTMQPGDTRTIVIGKEPCGINDDPKNWLTCDRLLRYFLPANATLIIYGPAGTPYRYEGRPG